VWFKKEAIKRQSHLSTGSDNAVWSNDEKGAAKSIANDKKNAVRVYIEHVR
jgi:hypothetical protein